MITATTRRGQPFDHDDYTLISLSDYREGMEVQVDGDWNDDLFEPWTIYTVLQADDGRLYVEGNSGPVFLKDLAEELDPGEADLVWGMFYVPLHEDCPAYECEWLENPDGTVSLLRTPIPPKKDSIQ